MRLHEHVQTLSQSWKDTLFPVRCLLCGVVGKHSPCPRCVDHKLGPTRPTLPKVPFGVTALFAATAYEGDARSLITALKYRGEKPVACGLAVLMAAALPDDLEVDVVTWAPTSVARRRKRGFDQAELLANELAQRIGMVATPTLTRLAAASQGGVLLPDRRSERHQTGRSLSDRKTGVRFATLPALFGSETLITSVLLVDDVVTSGATMAAAAVALRGVGVREVWASCAAFTPRSDLSTN